MAEVQQERSGTCASVYGGPLTRFEFTPVFAPLLKTAEAIPEEIAIVQGERQLSYAQLARDSLAVAGFLSAAGHRAPERIGVCVERSIEAVCAMLGVLAAGLVYVPIDVRNPRERVDRILRTSSVRTVLISAGGPFEGPSGLDLVPVAEAIAGGPDDAPPAAVDPSHPAYVLYTSGTTAEPRGVVGGHLQLSKQLHGWKQIGYDHAPGTRTAAVTSYGFAPSFLEHFLTLDAGGRLYVFEHQDVCDTESLASMIDRHRIEFAILSPALLGGVASYFEVTGRELPLRYLVSGGEPVPNDALRRFHALRPELEIRVGYGTTEVTVGATTHRFDPNRADARNSPIGRPLPGYHVLLLDEQRAPVPRGAVGEIYVSGDVLTKGYESNAEETRRRYVPNPFFDPAKPGDMHRVMYRTGDLAELDAHGDLVFGGRVDNQVQIRGLRIELGEVEAAVARVFETEACCTVAERPDDSKTIVAYIVKADRKGVQSGLEALERALPEYMLPSHLVLVDEFPITINDKVDRSRLPEPRDEHLIARYKTLPDLEPSASEAERDIIERARALLDIDGAISPTDRFVDLGADSLKIVRLVVDVQRGFSVKLPVKQMNARELSARSLARYVEASAATRSRV